MTRAGGNHRARDRAFWALLLLGFAGVFVTLYRYQPMPEAGQGLDTTDRHAWELIEAPAPGVWRRLVNPAGAVVDLRARPARIVSGVLAADELLLEVCETERLTGLSRLAVDERYSNVVERARALDRSVTGSAEQILSLRPDLVFVASFTSTETVAQLTRSGVTALHLVDFSSIDAVLDNARAIGFAIGSDRETSRLLSDTRERLELVRGRLARAGAPRVVAYVEGTVYGANTSFDSVMRWIGARNVAAEQGLTGYPTVSLETLATWDPDYVFMGVEPGKETLVVDALLRAPVMASTRIDRERIITLPERLFGAVSQHIATFAEQSLAELQQRSAR